ncbi:MAG: hypothetical protein WC813_01380 [Patescibacteria group bacterium]|jgi:hypothetical protein
MKTFREWQEFHKALWIVLKDQKYYDRVDAIKLTCENIGEQIARDNNIIDFHEKMILPPKRRLKKKARDMIQTLQTGLDELGIKVSVPA